MLSTSPPSSTPALAKEPCQHGLLEGCLRCRALTNWSGYSRNEKTHILPVKIGKQIYQIKEGGGNPKDYGLWLWPAEVALAEEVFDLNFEGMRVLELGAGIGLAGLAAREVGGIVTFMDKMPMSLQFMENARLNPSFRISFSVREDWRTALPYGADALIAADVLYLYGEHEDPCLPEAIKKHWNGKGPCLVCDPGRHKDKWSRPWPRLGWAFTGASCAAR